MNGRRQRGIHRYEDIPLPVRKIVRIGNSYGITIPYGIIEKYKIEKGDQFVITLHRRITQFTDEIPNDEAYEQRLLGNDDEDIKEDIKDAIAQLDALNEQDE